MRSRVVGVVVVAMVGVLAAGAANAAKAKPAAKAGPQQVNLLVNGAPVEGSGLIVNGVPLAVAPAAVRAVPVGAPGVTVSKTAQGETKLDRPEAMVRVKPGAKEMHVDGQRVALATPAVLYKASIYVPAQVLQALFPDYQIALTYQPARKSVLLTYKRKQAAAAPLRRSAPPVAVAPRPPAGGPACGPTTPNAAGVPTQEFGKKGAKLEIVALLPITHGCHVRTEAELKKAYQEHPKDIHLIIADLFGSDAPKYLSAVGGVRSAVFAINGKTNFTLDGQPVTFERQEGGLYDPSQIIPVIEDQLKAK